MFFNLVQAKVQNMCAWTIIDDKRKQENSFVVMEIS